MTKLENLGFSDLFPAIKGLARLGLIGELSGELLYRIFTTGLERDAPDDEADAVIDAAAAQLIIGNERRDILPRVADLIFRRNRRGLYIHDLVWCFFHDVSAEALAAIAGYLLSDDERDVRLACLLLHLPEYPETAEERRAAHDRYLKWLAENRPFLYLSGEHFNYASNPEALKRDAEALYLHREISPKTRAPIEPLTEDERRYLAAFRSLPADKRELLAEHSIRLHRGDVHAWREWIEMSAAEQVMSAKTDSEAV